jgi:hypothetical protein
MALKGVEIEPMKLGGNYYRVSEWAAEGYPSAPDVAEAIWRRHNLFPDIIETQAPLKDVVALDCEKESIPANGIGNWTDGRNFGTVRDEEAFKPFKLHSDSWNQCCGQPYDLVRMFAVAEYKLKRDGGEVFQVAALARLRERMKVEPLGHSVAIDPIVLADWKELVTARPMPLGDNLRYLAADNAKIQTIIKTTTIEAKALDPEFTTLQEVPGWTPTNAYVGTAQITNTSATGAGTRVFRNDTGTSRKIGQQLTGTVGGFTLGAVALSIHKHEAAAGNLNGELTLHVADGATVGEGANQVAYVISAFEVPVTTSVYLHFGGAAKALAATPAVYNFWLEYSGTTDANNYFHIDYNTQYAGGDGYDYDGAAWNAMSQDLKMYLCDTADGGKGVIRADTDMATFATNCKGAAWATTDTYTVTMGATLTRSTNITVLQGRQGDTVTGAQAYAVQGAIGVASATYRYGYEVVNAGVTVTWTGNVTATNSGYIQNPTTADTSSKSCRITPNGASGNAVTFTSGNDTYNDNTRWSWNAYYGGITSGCGYVILHGWQYNAYAIQMGAGTTYTTQTELSYPNWTVTFRSSAAGYFVSQIGTGLNLGLTFTSLDFTILALTSSAAAFLLNPTSYATGWFVRWPRLKMLANAYSHFVYGLAQNAAITVYAYNDGIYYDDARFSEATPTTFAVADRGTGGELTVTVSAATIAALAPTDTLVFYDSGGNEIGSCPVAAYTAALYDKAANCWPISGFVNDTPYNGCYCKSTRDRILFSAASNTANGTPTAPAPEAHTASQVIEAAGGNVHLPTAAQVDRLIGFGPSSATMGTLVSRLAQKALVVPATNLLLVAKTAGIAGNSITVECLSDEALGYSEVGNAITITYEDGVNTWQEVITKINAESTLIDASGSITGDCDGFMETSLADGLNAVDEPATTSVAADDTTGGVAGAIALSSILTPRGTAVAEAHVQSSKPGAFTLTDSGDGQTWTLAVPGDKNNWTVYLIYNYGTGRVEGTAVLKSTYPAGAKVKGLIAEQTYFLYAIEPGKLVSDMSDESYECPDLVANYSAGSANIRQGQADRVDGAVANGAIPQSDIMPASGGTSDKLYSAAEYAVQFLIDEALRNNPDGITNAQILTGKNPKIKNVQYTGSLVAGLDPPEQCALTVTISGTTASLALTNLPALATAVKVYFRLSGERTWSLGATITMPTATGSIAGLTKSKLYEFIAVTFNGTQVGYSSNLERKWVADTSKFKAILDRVEAEIEALAWAGWATSQVTIAWSPALVKDKAMPRVAVAPGNAPDSIVAQTNTSYSVAFPVRLYLMDRVSTRDAQMEALLAKREALRQLFMQRNVLSEVDGVFNVRVEPMPVVNDPDIDERMLITGVELAVEVEEAR